MKKIFVLLLGAALLLGALAGCGGSKSASGAVLQGTWRAELDMADMLNEQLAASGMGEFVNISDFDMALVLDLKDNGTYSMTMDEDALANSMEGVKDQLKAGITAYFEKVMPGQSVESALATVGMNIDDLMDQALNVDNLSGSFKVEGQYRAEEGKLYLSSSVDAEPTSNYVSCQQSGDTLTLDEGSTAAGGSMAQLLPMVFQRVG